MSRKFVRGKVLCGFYVYIVTCFCSFHRFVSILSRFFNFLPPRLLNFGNFSDPPFYSDPPRLLGTWDYFAWQLGFPIRKFQAIFFSVSKKLFGFKDARRNLYQLFVNDSFASFGKPEYFLEFAVYMNKQHPSISFSREPEKNRFFPFFRY